MTIIFGYEKVKENKTINNVFKFINNNPPVNLGITGCVLKNIEIKESVLFNTKKLNKHLQNINFNETDVESYKNHSFLKEWFDIDIKQIDQINSEDKYYFVVDVFDINFFNDVRKASDLSLSKKIIIDIKNKKSKILVLCCAETIIDISNIYLIFNSWSKKFNIPMDSIVFSSGDYSIDKYKDINYIPFSMFEHRIRSIYIQYINKFRVQIKRIIQKKIKRTKIFLNYNRRPTFQRCNLVYKLKQQNLFEYGLISLGWKKELLDDDIKKYFPDDFLNTFPITFDNSDLEDDKLFLTLVKQDFIRSYVSLISETLVAPKVIFPTEKIWKSIALLHPFIVIAQPGFLKQLKKFGYKTFSKWFDESYDQEQNEEKRLNLIINEIKKLTKMSHEDLQNMMLEMLPTLKYNFIILMKRGKSKQFTEQLKDKLMEIK